MESVLIEFYQLEIAFYKLFFSGPLVGLGNSKQGGDYNGSYTVFKTTQDRGYLRYDADIGQTTRYGALRCRAGEEQDSGH